MFLVKGNKEWRDGNYVGLPVGWCSSGRHMPHIDDLEA
jgi:hypothetical protein